MKVNSIYNQVAKELGIPKERVRMIYSAYWNCIKDGIKSFDLHDGMTKEDFEGKRYGYFIQKVGKLYCDYSVYKRKNNKLLNSRKNAEDNED